MAADMGAEAAAQQAHGETAEEVPAAAQRRSAHHELLDPVGTCEVRELGQALHLILWGPGRRGDGLICERV
jgi:hypothetical protein